MDIERAVRRASRDASFAFLSRWQFERTLDALAEALKAELGKQIRCSINCAILYRTLDGRYRVGGSSASRLRMEPDARYYDVATEEGKRSFTGFCALYGVRFVLNDFQAAVRKFRPKIRHRKKAGELGRGETRGFLALPSTRDTLKVTDGSKLPVRPETQADSIVRFNFKAKGCASRAMRILGETLDLDKLFAIIRRGRERAIQPNFHGLAIADLHDDLLRYRNREIDGLERLAFHLQTLYGNCEVSIFTAHKNPKSSARRGRIVDLELSATTALSDLEQHQRFRSAFFDFNKSQSYSCTVKADGSVQKKKRGMAKTEMAYARHPAPYSTSVSTSSRKFPEHGEIQYCRSFLGISIPAPSSKEGTSTGGEEPYGVIRVVHRDKELFTDDDERLAAAIARGLGHWLDFFPRNEDLEIRWDASVDKRKVLDLLFGPEAESLKLEAQERELSWFLQKVFVRARSVTITKSYSGKSGTVVLLVKNDAGLDLILKCAQRESLWREQVGSGHREILGEVRNYRDLVEGKVRLNHSVIYPDLLRQTRRLIGFATSFLGSQRGNLISLTELCENKSVPLGSVEGVMSRTYERLVRDVWGWWYEQAEQVGPKRLKDVLDDLLSDPLFDFTKGKGMAKFDKRFEDKMAVLTESAALLELTPKLVKPSRMWLRFRDRVRRSRVPFAWRETVTHGDLHGDNIFCDTAGSSVWLIDFARTARRIDIFDLAMLESDLKFRHLPTLVRGALGPEFMARYRRFESDLASQRAYERLVLPEVDGVPELRTVSKLVADIRQLAAQRLTRRGSNLDYMMVLFLLALKYMKLKEMTAPEVLLPYTSASEILARAFQRRGKRR